MTKPDVSTISTINVLNFAKARASELALLTAAISADYSSSNFGSGSANRHRTKRTFQRLPRHLRRRTMSHLITRIPSRLRARAKAEMISCASGNNISSASTARIHKLKRRKARQRRFRGIIKFSKDLFGLERQTSFKWTRNHIWHAKRFHMTGLWGWKMAMSRNDRGFRASYRSCQSGCTIYDASSFGSYQLDGLFKDIAIVLKSLCPMLPSSCFTANTDCTKGSYAFITYLHAIDSYPKNPIAQIQCCWKQHKEINSFDSEMPTSLFIFVHPSASLECVNEIRKLIKTVNINIEIHSHNYSRFELRGNRSAELISRVFTGVIANNTESDLLSVLSTIDSPCALSPMTVFALNNIDRSQFLMRNVTHTVGGEVMPKKTQKKKTVRKKNPLEKFKQIAHSELLTMSTEKNKLSLFFIQSNGARMCHSFASTINKRAFGSGFDIIVDRTDADLLWRVFVFKGAHPVGLVERNLLQTVRGLSVFPQDTPDSSAGRACAQLSSLISREKCERRPKGKRVNFKKIGITDPFVTQKTWEALTNECRKENTANERLEGSEENRLVRYALFGGRNDNQIPERFGLRRREKASKTNKQTNETPKPQKRKNDETQIPMKKRKLEFLNTLLEKHKEEEQNPPVALLVPSVVDYFVVRSRMQLNMIVSQSKNNPNILKKALICVSLHSEGKGSIKENARIFLLSENERKRCEELFSKKCPNATKKTKRLQMVLSSFHTNFCDCLREHSLIGYVTSGTYSFLFGSSIGVGFIRADFFLQTVMGSNFVKKYQLRTEGKDFKTIDTHFIETLFLVQNITSRHVFPVSALPVLT